MARKSGDIISFDDGDKRGRGVVLATIPANVDFRAAWNAVHSLVISDGKNNPDEFTEVAKYIDSDSPCVSKSTTHIVMEVRSGAVVKYRWIPTKGSRKIKATLEDLMGLEKQMTMGEKFMYLLETDKLFMLGCAMTLANFVFIPLFRLISFYLPSANEIILSASPQILQYILPILPFFFK